MKTGTKSVLFGAHCFFIHPWFVALAWWKLYGFPWDPRLWLAFFVHDLGYYGLEKMDDEKGELHPLYGARLMTVLFDKRWKIYTHPEHKWLAVGVKWGHLVAFHSRYLAKRYGVQPSRLCPADKLAIALEPWWLYLPRVMLSGEINEYISESREKHPDMNLDPRATRRGWFEHVQNYCRAWAYQHKDGKEDTWTQKRA